MRRSEIVGLRIHEIARHQFAHRHLDCECLVRLDRVAVFRVDELGAGHVRRARDDTYRRGVAGTASDLLTIRDRLVHGQAEVDEVVRRRQRGDLTRIGTVLLTIVGETRRNNRRVER